jgi:predicted ATPase/transcriptional regulator with XRE-family HTH domain
LYNLAEHPRITSTNNTVSDAQTGCFKSESHVIDYSFGSWIKRRRKALDLTQRELADRVGCSVSAIFKIESDDRRPSRQIAELLAEHLQIPAEKRQQFLKIARQEKNIDTLGQVPIPQESLPLPALHPGSAHFEKPARIVPQLPQPLTSLVGREHELDLILQQLREPHCRVLTLTGLGGVGKTRLAIEAAHHLQEAFTGGVFFAPLAGVRDPEFFLPALADALGFSLSGPGDPGIQLLHFLQDRQVLLVLDNFEHLLSCIDPLTGILQGAPDVKFLVTSREPLNVQAEWALEVQGLPVPAGEPEADLQSSSAAQLFVQRARQANLGFELAPEDHPAVLEICRLVEGLPLGIELAAAWVRVLSCQQIAEELERNLDFLKASTRDLPQRQRSLRAALDYSWDLLTPSERDIFRRLSVFRGGFTRQAAREVAWADLEEIAALLNKSLLKRAGEERYDLHELVRQYAASRLDSDPQELERTQERFRRFYADRMEQWMGSLRGPGQVGILREISAEIDNLRQAWSWMVSRMELANLLKSVHCLWHFHEIRGRYQEAETLFGGAVAEFNSHIAMDTLEGTESQLVHGILLAHQGYFCTQLGRYEQARDRLQKSLDLLRSSGDRTALAIVLTHFAYLEYRLGEWQLARRSAMESLDFFRALDHPVGIAYGLIMLSYIHQAQAEYEQAYALSSESLSICRDRLGDPHGTADSLITLSSAAKGMGDFVQAGRWAQEGLEICQATRDRWGTGQTLWQLAMIRFELGQAREAVDLLRQSIFQFREAGDRPLMAEALVDLGLVLRASGSPIEARTVFEEAFRVALETQTSGTVLKALLEIAVIEMEQGETEKALERVTWILKNADSQKEIKEHAGRLQVEWRDLLPPGQFEAVQARAKEKTIADFTSEVQVVG